MLELRAEAVGKRGGPKWPKAGRNAQTELAKTVMGRREGRKANGIRRESGALERGLKAGRTVFEGVFKGM